MSLLVKDSKDRERGVETIVVKLNGKKREVNKIMVKIGKKAYVLWELIIAFVTSSDGFGLQTKDGYIIKLKDQ